MDFKKGQGRQIIKIKMSIKIQYTAIKYTNIPRRITYSNWSGLNIVKKKKKNITRKCINPIKKTQYLCMPSMLMGVT